MNNRANFNTFLLRSKSVFIKASGRLSIFCLKPSRIIRVKTLGHNPYKDSKHSNKRHKGTR